VDDLAMRLGTGLSLRTSLAGERLERTADRLSCAVRDLIAARRNRSERLAAELNALSPLRVLQRGYAVPTTLEGGILKRTADFVPDLPFRLRVADGEVRARVESDR
jgi:exodeoxyribonuclease VII large subunit